MSYFVTGGDRLHRAQPGRAAARARGNRSTCSCARARWGGSRSCGTAGAPTRSASSASSATSPSRSSGSPRTRSRELKGKVDHFFHLAAIYDMTRRRREPARRQRRGHPPRGRARRGGRGRALPHGQLDRRRRPLQGHLARGHVRGGRGPRHPSLLPDQARLRGRRARRVRGPWRVYRPGIVVGHSETGEMDKIDGPYYFFKLIQQLRNAAAAVDADASASRAGDQHRAGRLRGRGDGPHRPPKGSTARPST